MKKCHLNLCNIFGAIILKSVSKVYRSFHHIHKGTFHNSKLLQMLLKPNLRQCLHCQRYVGNLTSLKFRINIHVYCHIIFTALVAVKCLPILHHSLFVNVVVLWIIGFPTSYFIIQSSKSTSANTMRLCWSFALCYWS